MTDSAGSRLGPLSGVLYGLLGLGGVAFLYPSGRPSFVDSPAEIAQFYVANDSDLLRSSLVAYLAAFFLLWFVGTLAARLRVAEGGAGRLGSIAQGGGVAAATLLLAAASMDFVAALRVDREGGIDPQVATVLWDIGSILLAGAAPFAFAAMLVAAALGSFRHGALPLWLGGIAGLLALACLIPSVAYFVVIGTAAWVVLAGLAMLIADSRARGGVTG